MSGSRKTSAIKFTTGIQWGNVIAMVLQSYVHPAFCKLLNFIFHLSAFDGKG